jgi:hypothetical protein
VGSRFSALPAAAATAATATATAAATAAASAASAAPGNAASAAADEHVHIAGLRHDRKLIAESAAAAIYLKMNNHP